MSINTNQIITIHKCLYPNIRLATSYQGVFSGTYKGIGSLLKTLNEKSKKSFNKLKNTYELEFNSYLMYNIDSTPIPFLFNPNLGLKTSGKNNEMVFEKEAQIYNEYYLAIKMNNIDTEKKQILLWNDAEKKLILQECNIGFTVEKLLGHDNIYYFQIKNVDKLFNNGLPKKNDTREHLHNNEKYNKCIEKVNEQISSLNEKIKDMKEQNDKFNDENRELIGHIKTNSEQIKNYMQETENTGTTNQNDITTLKMDIFEKKKDFDERKNEHLKATKKLSDQIKELKIKIKDEKKKCKNIIKTSKKTSSSHKYKEPQIDDLVKCIKGEIVNVEQEEQQDQEDQKDQKDQKEQKEQKEKEKEQEEEQETSCGKDGDEPCPQGKKCEDNKCVDIENIVSEEGGEQETSCGKEGDEPCPQGKKCEDNKCVDIEKTVSEEGKEGKKTDNIEEEERKVNINCDSLKTTIENLINEIPNIKSTKRKRRNISIVNRFIKQYNTFECDHKFHEYIEPTRENKEVVDPPTPTPTPIPTPTPTPTPIPTPIPTPTPRPRPRPTPRQDEERKDAGNINCEGAGERIEKLINDIENMQEGQRKMRHISIVNRFIQQYNTFGCEDTLTEYTGSTGEVTNPSGEPSVGPAGSELERPEPEVIPGNIQRPDEVQPVIANLEEGTDGGPATIPSAENKLNVLDPEDIPGDIPIPGGVDAAISTLEEGTDGGPLPRPTSDGERKDQHAKNRYKVNCNAPKKRIQQIIRDIPNIKSTKRKRRNISIVNRLIRQYNTFGCEDTLSEYTGSTGEVTNSSGEPSGEVKNKPGNEIKRPDPEDIPGGMDAVISTLEEGTDGGPATIPSAENQLIRPAPEDIPGDIPGPGGVDAVISNLQLGRDGERKNSDGEGNEQSEGNINCEGALERIEKIINDIENMQEGQRKMRHISIVNRFIQQYNTFGCEDTLTEYTGSTGEVKNPSGEPSGGPAGNELNRPGQENIPTNIRPSSVMDSVVSELPQPDEERKNPENKQNNETILPELNLKRDDFCGEIRKNLDSLESKEEKNEKTEEVIKSLKDKAISFDCFIELDRAATRNLETVLGNIDDDEEEEDDAEGKGEGKAESKGADYDRESQFRRALGNKKLMQGLQKKFQRKTDICEKYRKWIKKQKKIWNKANDANNQSQQFQETKSIYRGIAMNESERNKTMMLLAKKILQEIIVTMPEDCKSDRDLNNLINKVNTDIFNQEQEEQDDIWSDEVDIDFIIGIQESLGTSTKQIVSILIKNLEKIKTCINTVLKKLSEGKIDEAKTPRTSSRARLRKLITDINTQLFPRIELIRRYLEEQDENNVLIKLDEITLTLDKLFANHDIISRSIFNYIVKQCKSLEQNNSDIEQDTVSFDSSKVEGLMTRILLKLN